jgi:hypothetical protein
MLANDRMRDVSTESIVQALSRLTAGVEKHLSCAWPQKPDTMAITHSDIELEIEHQRLLSRYFPAAAAVFILKFDFVLGFTEHFQQFISDENHEGGLLALDSPDNHREEGRLLRKTQYLFNCVLLYWICRMRPLLAIRSAAVSA